MKVSSELLLVQKLIFLLDDFHFQQLTNHLTNSKAVLPLRLANTIRSSLPAFDNIEELCEKIYENAIKSHKAKFNQLSAYTFRFTSYLANNYPAYLHHNHSRLQITVNAGTREETVFLAEVLLEMAEKVGDFECQMVVLKFFCYQSVFIRDSTLRHKYNLQLTEAVEMEKLCMDIQSNLWEQQFSKPGMLSSAELAKYKAYFIQFHNHPCTSVRIFSLYAYFETIYQYDILSLLNEAELQKINMLEKELENHGYLVMPFMSDIRGRTRFLKLNSPLMKPGSEETNMEFEELQRYYENSKFWKNYPNTGESYLIAIQGTRLLTLYHYKLHLAGYAELITPEDRKVVSTLLRQSEELLKRFEAERNYDKEIMGLKMLHGALLLFTGGAHIKKGIAELEMLLITYQQTNMGASTDSIFLCLMAGYFALKDYDKCHETFRRYARISKNKKVNPGNNIKIHTYYYISQWLLTGYRQFTEKLRSLLNRNYGNDYPESIRFLVDYFKVPLAE